MIFFNSVFIFIIYFGLNNINGQSANKQQRSLTLSSHHTPNELTLYKIAPKPCKNEKTDESGVCMFVWECLKSDGRHLAMCKDGFMFGSCCAHNNSENAVEINFVTKTTVGPFEGFVTSSSEKTTQKPAFPPFPSYEPLDQVSSSEESTVEINNSILLTTSQQPISFNASTTSTSTTTTEPSVTTTNSAFTEIPETTTSLTIDELSTLFIDPSLTTIEPMIEGVDPKVGCGVAPLHPQMRIVGGKESSFANFPWITSVRRTSFFGFSSTHRCGGALLNPNWIATAGHCVDDLLTSQIRVRLGEWDFSSSSEKYPHIERGIKKKVVHPNYNFFTYENDLALLNLETPVQLSPHITPLCLPGNNDLLIGENATLAGWGRLSEGGQLPNRLQQVTVPIISNEACRELFLKSGRVEHIPDIFLCAGYELGGMDSCQGDSGGPLQIRGKDGRWFLGGIISWGIGCAEPNMPGVCTRISKFRDWILEQVT